MNFPRRWQDHTLEHDAAATAWTASRDAMDTYCGHGCCPAETVIQAALIARTDASLVMRMHTCDWSMLNVGATFRLESVTRSGRKAWDLSSLLPEGPRTFYAEADDRIPKGRGLLLTERGDEVMRVLF